MSREPRFAVLLLAVASAMLLSACESTQDKAKKLAAAGQDIGQKASVTITQPNKQVKVTGTTFLNDQYGDAIVVELRNDSKQPQVNVPIVIDERGADGKSVYRNDIPGLDPALNHVPLIEPGKTFEWVNDQVQPVSPPKSVKVTLGASESAPPKLPEIEVGSPKIETDSSGVAAKGSVTNKSQLAQIKLVLFGVVHQGGKVVAAGRGAIKALKPSKSSDYTLFFIGNAKGGDVSVVAPPSVVK